MGNKTNKWNAFLSEYLEDEMLVSLKTFIRAKEDQYMYKHNDKCWQFSRKRIDRFLNVVFAIDGSGQGSLYHPFLLSEAWADSK